MPLVGRGKQSIRPMEQKPWKHNVTYYLFPSRVKPGKMHRNDREIGFILLLEGLPKIYIWLRMQWAISKRWQVNCDWIYLIWQSMFGKLLKEHFHWIEKVIAEILPNQSLFFVGPSTKKNCQCLCLKTMSLKMVTWTFNKFMTFLNLGLLSIQVTYPWS